MRLSVATANFYFLPFEETLDIITEAGFEYIELDLYSEWKQWAMAQHLKNMPMRQVIRVIHQSGLRVASIHETGGFLANHHTTAGYINPLLDEALDQLGYAPIYLVFHPPQVDNSPEEGWWERISDDISYTLEPYRKVCTHLTLENLALFNGFSIPLLSPEALYQYAAQKGLGVNVDTTHYAQDNVDLLKAAHVLQGNVQAVHLSDYQAGRTHVFIGEGDLDLSGFFHIINPSTLDAVTLECSVSSIDKSDRLMGHAEMVGRMISARAVTERLCEGK